MICFPQEISVEASGSSTGSSDGCEQPVSMGGGGAGLRAALGKDSRPGLKTGVRLSSNMIGLKMCSCKVCML